VGWRQADVLPKLMCIQLTTFFYRTFYTIHGRRIIQKKINSIFGNTIWHITLFLKFWYFPKKSRWGVGAPLLPALMITITLVSLNTVQV
jgi:hypothetical protein